MLIDSCMRLEKVITFWNNFIKEHHINTDDRVIVMENADLLQNMMPFLKAYRDKESGRRILVALPQGLPYEHDKVLYYETEYFNGLMMLPMDHLLRESLIVCSYEDGNIGRLVGTYDIEGKRVEVTRRDLIAQGMFGFKTTPPINALSDNIDNHVLDDIAVKDDCWNYVPKRNTKYEFLEYAKINLDKLIDEGKVKSTDRIFLFGKTQTGLRIAEHLRSQGIEITGVLDNKMYQGETFNDYNVYLPDALASEEYTEDIRVLISLYSFNRACEQLRSYGLKYDENIFVVTLPKRSKILSLDQELAEAKEKQNVAKSLLNQLYSQYPDSTINICPYIRSGDVYLISRFLQQDIEVNGTSHVIVVSSKSLARVASLLGIATEIMTQENVRTLSEWIGFCDANNARVIDANILTRVGENLHGVNGLSYNIMLNRLMFPELELFYLPKINQMSNNELLESYTLDRDKTIILSPYANTMAEMPLKYWENIAKRLIEQGYVVYTNVAENQKPVLGTEGIEIPYENVIWCVEQCKAFIGIRSGLCDIISTADCKLLIFYKGTMANGSTRYMLYGLRKMGIRQDNLYEVDLEENGDYMEAIDYFCR